MKRVGYLYEKIYDIENIKLAIKNATKHKKSRKYVQRVLANPDYYAQEIQNILKNHSFKCGRNRTKVIKDGYSQKTRNITIPQFYPDQIIHWAVMQVLQPIFMKSMYPHNCGSVPGKGGLAAKRYIERVQSKKKAKYVLKLDIHHFFASVNHGKLKELLARKVKDKAVLALVDEIIDGGGEGLPIGYYSSQWLSNFYLERVDFYIKHDLKIKFYCRYVDDKVLLDNNKRKLHRAREQLAEYLKAFGLELKGNWQLWKNGTRPIDFVGYRFCRGKRTRLRKRLFLHISRTAKRIKEHGLNLPRARRILSLLGWGKRINFRAFYLEKIKPIISKAQAKLYISARAKGCVCIS